MHDTSRKVFLCGIGGSGMSALALVLLHEGYAVHGSDRSHDMGETPEKFAQLEKAGVRLSPQDGSGLSAGFESLIVSSAIEERIPDIQAARSLGIPVVKRADVLAAHFNAGRGIAVGGTSGKSTVTAMLGHILSEAGRDPTVINGAAMVNALARGAEGLGNAVIGDEGPFVIEADESDGSIVLYEPDIAVLTNISLDHKPVEITRPLFETFLKKAKTGAVVNLDNADSAALAGINPRTLTFSLHDRAATFTASEIVMKPEGSYFSIRDNRSGETVQATLKAPGRHNIENALAAVCAAVMAGVPLAQAATPLAGYRGVKRRLEVLGTENGITVIDDFGHNPDKVAASLMALKQAEGRLIVMFQPHGFEPMRLMGKDIAQSFANALSDDDILVMPEILYKGGTVNRDISSGDLLKVVADAGVQAHFIPAREDVMAFLLQTAKPGDRVVIMGARDDSLTDFALDFLAREKGGGAAEPSAESPAPVVAPPQPPLS